MINSINWIDGLDGLSTGIALIAAFTLGLISLTTPDGGSPRRRAVLRAGRRPARVPALELPPGDDLRRDERRDVRRLHPGGAVDPRHGQGGRRAARAGRADHRHVLDHRPAASRALAVQPGPGHVHHRLLDLGLSHRQTVFLIYGMAWCWRAGAPPVRARASCTPSSASSSPSGSSCSCRRGGPCERPVELEADAYKSDPTQGARASSRLLRRPATGSRRC